MNKNKRTLQRIKKELVNLGPMLPGTLGKQWNVCGTPRCRCKDPKNPLRHGPYFQLSFSIQGKSSSLFIKKEDVAEVQKRILRYEKFKKLTMALIQAHVELARKMGMQRRSK